MSNRRAPVATDEGLQQIADLEKTIVLAQQQTWSVHGVSAEEIARELPAVVAQAKAVCDQLRREYLERSGHR